MSSTSFEPGLFLRVFVLGQLLGDLLEREFADIDVSAGDFGITSTLRIVQPVTPTVLATSLGMPPTTLSAAIRRLERRGHVRRDPNPGDGRSFLLALTDEGERVVTGAFPAFAAARARVDDELGGRWSEVAAELGKLEDALRAAMARTAIS